MQDSSVDEIKSKLSIEEVVGSYLQLSRAGRNLKACCPFHNEKSPSFMVSPERQSWHCFGCGEGGDIFSFVMKMEGVEFVDALKLLAERSGVELRRGALENRGHKTILVDIIEESKRFYRKCFEIKAGRKAYEYMEGRGISEEMMTKYELGYAPDSWSLLSEYLRKKGFKDEDILAAGMTVKNERGKVYDRFRGRIMFPVCNIGGQAVGFSSRIMPGGDESSAKYINTPETPVYNKGRILFGLDKSKIFLRQKDQCVMVEGNVDVIASFQSGVNNVVATCGTALTPEQLRIIKRYTNNIVFSFDMDSAGVKAAKRGIDMALSEGMDVSVIRVPGGKDPADSVKNDPEGWRRAAANPIKVMDFYFESIFDKYDRKSVDGKRHIAAELLAEIAKVANKIEQSYYIQRLSSEIGMEEDILRQVMREERSAGGRTVRTPGPASAAAPAKRDREYKLQENLLGHIMLNPKGFKEQFAGLGGIIENKDFLRIYQAIEESYEAGKALKKEDLEHIRRKLEDESSQDGSQNLSSLLDTAVFSVEPLMDEEGYDPFKEAKKCIAGLSEITLRKKMKGIALDIKEAANNQDQDKLEELLREQIRLSGEIKAPTA